MVSGYVAKNSVMAHLIQANELLLSSPALPLARFWNAPLRRGYLPADSLGFLAFSSREKKKMPLPYIKPIYVQDLHRPEWMDDQAGRHLILMGRPMEILNIYRFYVQ